MAVGRNISNHLFDTSFTTNAILYSAASGVLTSVSNTGESGLVLTSNGSGSAPSFQNALADYRNVFMFGGM